MSLRETLLVPIPGEARGGTNLRYDPLYDRIKEARREDLDVPQGEWQQALKKADWPLVVRLASDALAKQSKDLQLAAWLTEALLRQDGFGGLQRGLDLVAGMLEEFWDELYPELEDGDAELRAVPLEWLGRTLEHGTRLVPINAAGHTTLDYLHAARVPTESEADDDEGKRRARAQAVDEGKLTPEEFQAEVDATPKTWYKTLAADVGGAAAALEALERIADERFGADAPSLIKLRTALQDIGKTVGVLLAQKLQADPDPVEVEEVVLADPAGDMPGAGDHAAPHGAPVPVATGAVRAPRSLDEAAAQLDAVARLLRGRAPADPAPYLMLRGYRWGELRRGGVEVDPRLLEAPPTELRSALKELVLAERWAEALEAGESMMAAPYGRGWLDLQRYSILACEALGGDHEALARALRGALRSLLQDVPRLPELMLLDDTPCANPDTRRWLAADGLTRGAGAAPDDAANGTGGASSGGAPLGVQNRARGLARQGETQRAVELLIREAASSRSERDRFLRRTEAASIMVEAGLEVVALPILNELLEQIETHQLERWEEGETVALPLALAHRCIAAARPDDSDLESLYLRICRLDPLGAIRLQDAAANGGSGS